EGRIEAVVAAAAAIADHVVTPYVVVRGLDRGLVATDQPTDTTVALRGIVVAADQGNQIRTILEAQRCDALQRRWNGYRIAVWIKPGQLIQCGVVGRVVGIVDLNRMDQPNLLIDAARRVSLVRDVDQILDSGECRVLAAQLTHET